jgi:hypothetical protein
MTQRIYRVLGALLLAAATAVPSVAAGRTTKAGEVPGEDAYRSAAGYHTAVMEHCKAINKLARAKGAFNVELAREHAAEVSRNLASASRHVESYLAALGPDRKGSVSEHAGIVAGKQGESQRLASVLGEALGTGAPDRKTIASTVTDLYLAERDLVTAHKAAGKTLGIRLATAPRKAAPRPASARKPPKSAEKAATGGQIGAAKSN